MAPIVKDWRVVFMQAHERLFDLIADEPQRSFGYPLCDAGWRGILERLCIKSKPRCRRTTRLNSFAPSRNSACLGPTETARF